MAFSKCYVAGASPRRFRSLTHVQAKEFYDFFMSTMPTCLEELESEVKTTIGFQNWKMDYSFESLDKTQLGGWFATKVKTRDYTLEEIEEEIEIIKKETGTSPQWSKGYIGQVNKTLKNETLSTACNVGMYYGQVAIKNFPELSWKLCLSTYLYRGKKLPVGNYGEPVVTKRGIIPNNPIGIAQGIARRIASGEDSTERLRYSCEHYWDNATIIVKDPKLTELFW